MKGQSMLIAALVFALIIAIFAVINVESVQVNFLFAKTTTPLILVILASTLLGGLMVGLFGMIRQYRLVRTVKSLEKQVAELSAGQPLRVAPEVPEMTETEMIENTEDERGESKPADE